MITAKALILLLVISLLFAGCGTTYYRNGSSGGVNDRDGSTVNNDPRNADTEPPDHDNITEWNGNDDAYDNDAGNTGQSDPINDRLKEMSLDEKIGQMLIIGIEGTVMDDQTQTHLKKTAPGGVILFGRNSDNPSQLLGLINSLKKSNAGRIPLLISVDEEGGSISRMPPQLHEMPSAWSIGQMDDISFTYEAGRLTAHKIKSFGFNMDFAPVLDILSNPENTVIGERAFGTTRETVISHGIHMMKGIRDNGVIPVVKHFPGHGDTDVDSHTNLPSVSHDLDRLSRFEFAPFRKAVDENADAVMAAHILMKNIDPVYPASLSETVINGILREEMGFDGVVITDDMTMGAITQNYDIGDASVRAVIAGCDIILICHDYDRQSEAFEAIRTSVETGYIDEGRIDESIERILRLKDRYGLSDKIIDSIDINSINEKIIDLMYNR